MPLLTALPLCGSASQKDPISGKKPFTFSTQRIVWCDRIGEPSIGIAMNCEYRKYLFSGCSYSEFGKQVLALYSIKELICGLMQISVKASLVVEIETVLKLNAYGQKQKIKELTWTIPLAKIILIAFVPSS